MDPSEHKVGSWLTRQGCHWIFVEQSAFSVADGAKRAKPQQQIHRPDFIAMMDGFGTIAVDVKGYKFQKTRAKKLEGTDETGEAFAFCPDVSWVKLVWEDVCGLFEFQRVSNIPAWLSIVGTAGDENCSAWFRADNVYQSFSRIFIAETLEFYNKDSRTEIKYFDDWQEIKLEADDTTGDKRPKFQVLVEHPDHVDIIGLTDRGKNIYVPPKIVNLVAHSSLRDLINIWPAKEISADAASDKQMAYAMAIAKTLAIALPSFRNKTTMREFISAHQRKFKEHIGRPRRRKL
jgi:hypothetical protein